jgi:hypothetical protein
MTRHFIASVAVGLVALWIASTCGCIDPRKTYVEPAAEPPTQTALLTSSGSCYIIEVDGQKMASGQQINEAGGNSVRVNAGMRKLRVYKTDPRNAAIWEFSFLFEPGHGYELTPESGTTYNLLMRDKNTGKTVVAN